jgi:hypothetical protein
MHADLRRFRTLLYCKEHMSADLQRISGVSATTGLVSLLVFNYLGCASQPDLDREQKTFVRRASY